MKSLDALCLRYWSWMTMLVHGCTKAVRIRTSANRDCIILSRIEMCKTDFPHHLNRRTAGQEKLTDVSITNTPSASSSKYGEYRCDTFRSRSGTRESTGGSSHPVGGMAGSLASLRYPLSQKSRDASSMRARESSPKFIRLATPLIDITVG